jgi:hypothetical protein
MRPEQKILQVPRRVRPGADSLGGLIALTRRLAGSLTEWREAA